MSNNPITDPSIELILIMLAKKHAPRLIPKEWRKPGDFKKPLHNLARQLANYHILVVLGERGSHPPQNIPTLVRECADIYMRLYHLLASRLFPTVPVRINASYYSYSRATLMIVFDAEARGVVEVMAGYIAPYVVERQGSRVSPLELQGLMDKTLEKLEAKKSDQAAYQQLRDESIEIIKQLLAIPLRQVLLTRFDEPFFGDTLPPTTLPEQNRPQPFVTQDGVDAPGEGHEPDFIKQLYEPAKPPDRPRPPEPPTLPGAQVVPDSDSTIKEPEESPDTGPQPPLTDDGEPNRRIPPPARRSSGSKPPAPLPYWPKKPDDGES